MNYLNIFKTTLLTAGVLLFLGCLGDSTSSTPIKSELTETLPIDAMDSTTGAISENITIDVGEGKLTQTSINLSEGTQFINQKSKEVITEQPNVKVLVTNDVSESSTEISFTTSTSEKVVPTEPVKVSVVAPKGALPGERVNVTIPNSVNNSKRLEKVIFITIKADGTIDVVIAPDLFEGLLVVIVRRENRSTN